MPHLTFKQLNNLDAAVYCDEEQQLELTEYFATRVPGFQFHPKFKARIWDGYYRFYTSYRGTLPLGLLYLARKFVIDNGYTSNVDDVLAAQVDSSLSHEQAKQFISTVKLNPQFVVRDYQLESISSSLRFRRGIILSPTGSGKSLVIYLIIRYLLDVKHQRVLLIVPNISLVEQMWSDFEEYGWKERDKRSSILYSGKEMQTKELLISTWQSVYKRPPEFFESFGALLLDECHTVAKSVSIAELCKKCVNANYRVGFTGTLPPERIDHLTVQSYLGPQLFSSTSSEMIDKGILSQAVVASLILRYPEHIVEEMKRTSYEEEEQFVTSTPLRMQVFDFIFSHTPKGENFLVLCQKIEHLKAIEKYLETKLSDEYSLYVIYGEVSAKEREAIRKLTDERSNVIIIGTHATMSTGINIKRLHNVIFASSYKSKVKVLQSVGRGLRLHSSKERLILWDVVDDLSWMSTRGTKKRNYLLHHFSERVRFYKEQGFRIVTHQLQLKPELSK
jgi:superfamily II DNA or RNA helicase